MSIVKSFKQKTASGFTDKINFNPDGQNISMLSGLNLEEELHLGGRTQTVISTLDNNISKIEERYTDLYKTVDFYIISTFIKEQTDSTIILRVIKDSNNIFIKAKLTSIKNINNQDKVDELFCNEQMVGELFKDWGIQG